MSVGVMKDYKLKQSNLRAWLVTALLGRSHIQEVLSAILLGCSHPAFTSRGMRIRWLRSCIRYSRFVTGLSGSSDASECDSYHMPSFMQAATKLMPFLSVCWIDEAALCKSLRKQAYSLLSFVLLTYSSPASCHSVSILKKGSNLFIEYLAKNGKRGTDQMNLPC